jgi:chemotaxis protein methyltransferase CheR
MTITDPGHRRLAELARARIGAEITHARLPQLRRAVRRALEHADLPDVDALVRTLEHDPGSGLAEAFFADLTVQESHFRRSAAQFDALASHILPNAIERNSRRRRLRLWSAGCAGGEEPYSLAMLLVELLPDIEAWDVRILATDLDRRALERARRGVYRRWSLRGLDADLVARYFRPHGTDVEITHELRRFVHFEQLNLVADDFPRARLAGADVVLCRNVLMYLSAEAVTLVVARLHDALAPGGWLLVGQAEASQRTFGTFETHALPGVTAYRREREQRAAPAHDKAHDKASAGPRPAPAPPARPRPPAADAKAAFRSAKEHADAHDLDAALRWARVAAERDPRYAPSHYLAALVLAEQGRTSAAVEALRRCVGLDRDFALGHFVLASLLFRSGRRDLARGALETLESVLDGRTDGAPVEHGDGLTVRRLREMVAAERRAMEREMAQAT